jgi:hypothetical protein
MSAFIAVRRYADKWRKPVLSAEAEVMRASILWRKATLRTDGAAPIYAQEPPLQAVIATPLLTLRSRRAERRSSRPSVTQHRRAEIFA